MALFKKDSKNNDKVDSNNDLSWVILNPRITEKAAVITGKNIFTFDVAQSANKIQIKKAIAEKYNVTILRVNIISKKPKKVFRRGQKVHQKGSKKAMILLKKGDTIEFV